MPKKLSQEEFIERCKKKHNNYYSYDKTVYTGMSNDDYIIVTCPIHGDFKQLAAGHIRGKGCKDCAGTITKTTEQFIIDARKVHGDEYDYSKSKYINAMTYIEIICRKHGLFWQKPNTHLIGKGCFECYGSKMLTQEEFINRCIEKHNGFYIYDKTVYTGCNYTITITCPIHGDFQQKAGAHLYGQGCSQCAHLISTQELELREFLGTIYENEMIFNSRAFIKPKELDIYLPDIKTAFEYNGNYWHALYEENDPGYHDYKRQLCKNNIEYTLLNVSETGQYLFIAPTWKVNISQDDASIVETFNLAGTGKVGGSGSGSDPTYGLLKIIFVDALPPISEAKENTLYFVPKDGAAPDNYDEYIFDPVNQQFELVGQSVIDTSDFAKLSSTNIFLAPNTFNEIITFKKGLKVSESGPVITSNDTTLNLPNTSTPLLKAQSLILNGVSTFNNEIRVSTIAGLTQAPIKVTSAVNFNKPIKFNDTIRVETGKIDPGKFGNTWTFGSLIETPTTADNNNHRLACKTTIDNAAYILYHERVINGVWTKASIILACQFDFTWHNDASILVKTPTKAEQAANKNYVDTQISTISQFDSSSDQTISGTWKFSKPLKITEAQLTDEAVSKGYVDETIQQNLNTTLEGVIKFVSMTKAEYKALETKSPSTIYHLTDVSMWAIGDQEIVTSNMPA